MEQSIERWLPVLGYEDLYEVSDQGRVRSLDRVVTESSGKRRVKRGRIMRPMKASQGRGTVFLCRDGEKCRRFVYHLVLETFVGSRPPGMQACHGDGDATNDRLDNLRWDTVSANHRDKARHGTNVNLNKTHCPRGHEFIAINLHRSIAMQGGRTCLACSRAASNYASAVRRGIPADFQSLADEQYRQILEGKPRRGAQRRSSSSSG